MQKIRSLIILRYDNINLYKDKCINKKRSLEKMEENLLKALLILGWIVLGQAVVRANDVPSTSFSSSFRSRFLEPFSIDAIFRGYISEFLHRFFLQYGRPLASLKHMSCVLQVIRKCEKYYAKEKYKKRFDINIQECHKLQK